MPARCNLRLRAVVARAMTVPRNGAAETARQKRRGSKVHLAVDTLGHLLAVHVTPANEQERAQVAELAQQVQKLTGDAIKIAYVDQGYTGDQPAQDAAKHGIELHVIKLPQAKKGFVLLPRRWVVERSFAWAARACPLWVGVRRLARDFERLAETLAGLHVLAFVLLLLPRAVMLWSSCA